MRKKTSIIWAISKEQLEKIVKSSDTISAILKHFGIQNKGSNYRTLKSRLYYDNIDFSHIPLGKNSNKGRPKGGIKRPLELVLVENSTYKGSSLKKRLLKDNVLENKCYECGLSDTWNNKPLCLQIDHKNGISNDNRVENLRYLCPNCHSQTSTFAGRKLRKTRNNCINCGILLKTTKKTKTGLCKNCSYIMFSKNMTKVFNKPSKEDLKYMIEKNSLEAIGRKYKVSGNAVKKWAKKYNLV